MTRPPIPLSRRALLAGAVLVTSTACGLRLESDVPLPGPTAAPAPDSAPLETVREHLVIAMSGAAAEQVHAAAAAAVQPAHREQLKRLDATLAGIGASSLPVPTATGIPSVSPSPSSSSGTPESPAPASSSGTPRPSVDITPWTHAEAAWGDAPMSATLQRVSTHSRPLAMSIATRGIAALPPGAVVPWVAGASAPKGAQLLEPLATVIDALEWIAAHRPIEQREDVAGALKALYASRSLLEATDPAAARALDEPARRHASESEAKKIAAQGCALLESRCAKAATQTRTPLDVNGLLLVWSAAVMTGGLTGLTVGAFPGLAT